ncbi:hypothetical protein D9M72_432950 [compost metagenome]
MYIQRAHVLETSSALYVSDLFAPWTVKFHSCADSVSIALYAFKTDFYPLIAVSIVKQYISSILDIQEAIVV